MLYGGPEWLQGHDPNNYLEMWLGKKDGSVKSVASQYNLPMNKIHIGFIDYANESNGGYPGSSSDGSNAATLYQKMLQDLGYSPSDLGNTFWWPNEGFSEHAADAYQGVIETLVDELKDFNKGMEP